MNPNNTSDEISILVAYSFLCEESVSSNVFDL